MECPGPGALPALIQGPGGLTDRRNEARFPLNVLEQVKNSPMSRAQVRAVALCLVINLIDGFDLLVTSFVGPTITREWSLSPSGVGVLLSAGLAGMAIGGLFLAPLADRIGRRRLSLGCLALASLGMLAAAGSQDFGQLLACRVVTGAAVGAMAASLPVLTSEYANHRRRGLVVALITTGYGLGSFVAGIASSVLLGSLGWRSVFVFGAVVTAILFAVGLRSLPESMDYLVARRPRQALEKLNRILVSTGRAPEADLPAAPSASTSRKVALDSLFRGGNAVRTALVWVAFIAAQLMFYFASSWTPSLLLKAGMSNQQGISGGVLFSLGGVTGAVLFGLLASRAGTRRLTATYFAVSALALILFSVSLGTLATALVVAVLVGLFLNGTVSGMTVIIPSLYPAEARATALGLGVAVSRLGAVLAPLIAGFLLQAGWAPGSMFRVFAIPGVLGALAIIFLTRFGRAPRNSSSPAEPVESAVAEA
jgi:benzoate transport